MTKKLLKNKYLQFLFIICITGSVLACKKDTPAPTPPTRVAVKSPPQPAQKPIQKQISSTHNAQPLVNQFDFSNKKDPFKPFIIVKQTEQQPTNILKRQLRDGLPIHQYDVNQFRLIGVVTGSGESKAMVVDPKGKGYVLKLGMTIGKNDGKVIAINASGVSVTEQFKDDNGRVRRENIKITLPRKM